MSKLRLNSPGIEDEYLACLNTCFPGWGNRVKFDWYFRRENSAPAADLFVFEDDRRMVAGSAVTYRNVEFPNGNIALAGIMTGSWTLPKYRRQGYFTQAIHASQRIAAQQNAALLLAFVTADNASCRALTNAGAALFPTYYLFSTAEKPLAEPANELLSRRNDEESRQQIFVRRRQTTRGFSRFDYHTLDELKQQFFNRPDLVETLSDKHGNVGLLEVGMRTEALQLLLVDANERWAVQDSMAAFAQRAISNGRQFLFFTSDEQSAAAGEEIGLQSKPGYLTALAADETSLRNSLGLQRDAEVNAETLAAFIGHWAIAGGDRA